MFLRKILYCLSLSFCLIFVSCDEFMLRKTVSVQFLEGDVSFDPDNVSMSGDLIYTIKNKQNKTLQEIFFISHSQVIIDNIRYNGDTIRFEQGIGYGSGIYRIRVASLLSGASAKIEIKFHISGPVEEDRFLLTADTVFMDAKKIWLPVPFADLPAFLYSIKIITPDNYYTVMGGKEQEESVKNNKKTTLWESETDDILHTGDIFIGLFERIKKDNISVYTTETNNIGLIFDDTSKTIDFLSNRLWKYPYSQTYVVNELFQYKDTEEFIDGEKMANIVQISPELTSDGLLDDEQLENSAIPYIPRQSYAKLFEVLAHELSHAYVPPFLKFEEKDYIESESFAEYMGLTTIAYYNPAIYNKFIQRNRIDLINLQLANQTNLRLFNYIYGVNVLHSAFGENKDEFYNYVNMLIQKYSYTEVGLDELIQTASDLTDSEMTNLINGDALSLWKDNKLYNIELSYINVFVTNKIKKGISIDAKRMIIINNNFPIPLKVSLIERYPDRVFTNSIELVKNSNTNIIVEYYILSIEAKSKMDMLEEKLSDNRILFVTNNNGEMIINAVNSFYNYQKINSKNVKIDKTNEASGDFETIPADRERSAAIDTNIQFLYDTQNQTNNELYIQAYKLIAGKPYSYVIFKIKKERENYIISGVLDPLF